MTKARGAILTTDIVLSEVVMPKHIATLVLRGDRVYRIDQEMGRRPRVNPLDDYASAALIIKNQIKSVRERGSRSEYGIGPAVHPALMSVEPLNMPNVANAIEGLVK